MPSQSEYISEKYAKIDSESVKPTSLTYSINKPKNKNVKKRCLGENYLRVNYLFQASKYLVSQNSTEDIKNMSANLGSLCFAVGRKGVIRMSSKIKRQLCKGCGNYLMPGISCRVRQSKKRQKHTVLFCNRCKTLKKFNSNRYYELWEDKILKVSH